MQVERKIMHNGKRPWASRSEEIMNMKKENEALPEEEKEETPLLENKEA